MILDAPIRFLLILASDESDEAPNREMRVTRIAPPYYLFKDLGVEVVLATPLGGFPAMCEDLPPSSPADDATRRFMADRGDGTIWPIHLACNRSSSRISMPLSVSVSPDPFGTATTSALLPSSKRF